MIPAGTSARPSSRAGSVLRFGTAGRILGFAWLNGAVLLSDWETLLWVVPASILASRMLYPVSLKGGLRLRWLFWLAAMALPPLLFIGEPDSQLFGVVYSSEGLIAALQIALRFVVVLVVIGGFTATVDVTSLASLLERLGFQGLGFSLGVALNLLPSLRECARTTWHSMTMRGGLRKARWRGLQLLVLTIITQALRRAEEIALAAEARAFSPERSRPLPIDVGAWDRALVPVMLLSWTVVLLLR